MNCDYFTRGECVSCALIETPYEEQLAQRQRSAEQLLSHAPNSTHMRWLPPVASAPENFRTKAKMAVGGTSDAPTLGLLDAEWKGVDLAQCPILHPAIRKVLPTLRQFIADHRIDPYNVATRKGELKYILITANVEEHDDPARVELLIRFVLRSRAHEALLRSRLTDLRSRIPNASVVTINLHPKHAAVVEGDVELVLTQQQTIPLSVGGVRLHVGPRSFTQTNTQVAGELYRTVARWASLPFAGEGTLDEATPAKSVWDLYCGVGGFALHCAKVGVRHVTGVEISDSAIESAKVAASEMWGSSAPAVTRFISGDATAWALGQNQVPDVIIVNPPRRGIGRKLAEWMNASGARRVVYSSCNPKTLVTDLQVMDRYQVLEGRLFDMFPHTAHAEVAVLLELRA